MAKFMVNYDLSKPHRDYERLVKFLKGHTNWARALESCWIVVSNLSTAQLRDAVKGYIDSDDHLLVTNLDHGDSAWYNLDPDVANWLLGKAA